MKLNKGEYTLSKKLKRRIQELCGLQHLSREERLSRATEILNNTDLKQAICHQILGCTHRDIERAMRSAINERQLTEEQTIQLELEEMAPEKFDPELQFKVNKHASNVKKELRYKILTREETAALIAASNAPHVAPPPAFPKMEYSTYSREQIEAFVRDHYGYNKDEQQREKWDLMNTTESGPKTGFKMKRSQSTKT